MKKIHRLVIASYNTGKIAELSTLLLPYGIEILSAIALDLPEPKETGSTFRENAQIKALAGVAAIGLPTLGDDSGLIVTGLGGRPGIHTARWSGPERNYNRPMQRINQELGTNADRSAQFICSLVLAWPDGCLTFFEGRVDGTLIFPGRGIGGFGYDPFFIPEGHEQTFAEMTAIEKQKLSHRARALSCFIEGCLQTLNA